MFFINFTNGYRSKRIVFVIYYIGKGYFLTGPVKRDINFKLSNTLFRVSFVVLCLRISTQLTKPPWACFSPECGFKKREHETYVCGQDLGFIPIT